jgi:alpha-1,3-rhamnosyltransferase
MSYNPLVSIIIITYNSADFILETLESIKSQTYDKIEIIVSDDASIDNTPGICEEWLSKNGHLFVNSKVINASYNTGLAGNFNRGLINVKGEWVKIIAGDDLLEKDCISNNVKFVQDNNEAKVVFSKYQLWIEENGEWTNRSPKKDPERFLLFHAKMTAKDQLKLWRLGQFYRIISLFVDTDLLMSIGGWDEDFPFYEDGPLIYRILNKGERLFFLPKTTVLYRIHNSSISHRGSKDIFSKWYLDNYLPAEKKYSLRYLSNGHKFILNIKIKLETLLSKTTFNNASLPNKIIVKGLLMPISIILDYFKKREVLKIKAFYNADQYYFKK